MLQITTETALELVDALRVSNTRMELNDCEGEESPFIDQAWAALARLYALPGIRAAVAARESV